MNIKDILFKGLKGCSDSSCVVKKPVGMATNGGCRCMNNRANNNILWSRASQIDDIIQRLKNE
jgi:hypothetical protein